MCIVISNQEFPEKKNYREGSEHDISKLKYIFAHLLGFCFIVFNNLTASSVRSLLKAAAKVDFTKHQCFAFAMLSHGDENGITCSDGKPITVDEIRESFSTRNCSTLGGKPKIFIFQCCRGSRTNTVETISESVGRTESDYLLYYDPPNTPHAVPDCLDTITIYATNPGHRAYRHENQGSVFIEALLNAFNDYKNEAIDLLRMTTRMNNTYRRKCIRTRDNPMLVTQVATVESTLTLELYLPTIEWNDDP